jgi:hypothetical protein
MIGANRLGRTLLTYYLNRSVYTNSRAYTSIHNTDRDICNRTFFEHSIYGKRYKKAVE